MSRKSLKIRLAAVFACAALAFTACGSGGNEGGNDDNNGGNTQAVGESPRKAEDKLILIARQDPGTLDYTQSPQTALLLWIPGNIVEPLLAMDEEGNIGPGLAEYEVDDSLTEYTFTLKPNQFSNGEDVTVDDVVYSMTTMQESPVANWAAAYEQVESIEATGDDQVTVKLAQPSQAFFQGMASVPGLIQPEASASEIATNPIGTGPYQLEEYTQNARIRLTVNPNFQGDEPAIKEVEVRIVTDGAAAINALQSGEVDGMPIINNDLWERLRSEGLDQKLTLLQNPAMGERQFLILNSTVPALESPEARAAFAAAVDRDQIIAALNADWAMFPTCDYGLETDPWVKEANEENCPTPPDPAAAQDYANESGLSAETVQFVSLSDVPDLALPADILIEQFKGAGIQIEREAIDLARYSQTIFQGRPPQFEVTNMSDPADITQFTCSNPEEAGWTTYCSEEFTALVEQADAAPTIDEYHELLGQANEQLKKDAVIVPLTYTLGIGLAHPDLAESDAGATIFQEIPVFKMSWK